MDRTAGAAPYLVGADSVSGITPTFRVYVSIWFVQASGVMFLLLRTSHQT